MTDLRQAEPVAREGFEKWAKFAAPYMDISRFGAGYSDCNTDYAWAGWQAALAQPQQQAEPVPRWDVDEDNPDSLAKHPAFRATQEQQAEPVAELQQVGPVDDMMLRRAALRSAKIVFGGRFVTRQAAHNIKEPK